MHKETSLKHKLIIISLVSLLGIPPPISAKIYKWVGTEGNTHYSQSPPSGGIEGKSIKSPSSVDTDRALKVLDKQKKTADKLRKDRITK